MNYWRNTNGGCLAACVASLIGAHPGDLPQTPYVHEMDAWLRSRGKRLEPVYGSRLADAPAGLWLATLHRSSSVSHLVIARESEVIHDPGGHKAGGLWPSDLAAAFDRSQRLGTGWWQRDRSPRDLGWSRTDQARGVSSRVSRSQWRRQE